MSRMLTRGTAPPSSLAREPRPRSALLGLAALVGVAACVSEESHPDPAPGEVRLRGRVEKGPFILGSSVVVAPLDAGNQPTGVTFTTRTENDRGEFTVSLGAPGLVALTADGYYYNELTGVVSSGPQTLRGVLFAADEESAAAVNVVTHLTADRVLALIEEGSSAAEAIVQAEAELVGAVGLLGEQFTLQSPGAATSLLAGDSDDSAYLFALSAIMATAATSAEQPATDPGFDGRLQELLNATARDLAADGVLDAARLQSLRAAQAQIEPATLMALLAARIVALGLAVEVPDLDRVLDSDLDGLVNKLDNCRWLANPDQADGDADGEGDACECGNGTIERPQACDDGNTIDGDGCSATCTLPACADGIVDVGELCVLPQHELATAGPAVPNLADLDGDGAIDLFFRVDDAIAVHAGAGDGSFAPAVTVAVAGAGDVVRAGDFDGDGALDLAGLSADGVWVAFGLGGLAFAPATIAAEFPEPTQLLVLDGDGDGGADLVVASASDGQPLRGQPDQSFVVSPAAALCAPPEQPGDPQTVSNLAAGDFDGDGVQELYYAYTDLSAPEFHAPRVHGRRVDVAAGWDAVSELDPESWITPTYALLDLDGDGRDDRLHIARPYGGHGTLLFGTLREPGGWGDPGFTLWLDHETIAADGYAILTGRFTDDDHADVYLPEWDQLVPDVALADFILSDRPPPLRLGLGATRVAAVADLDGDGLDDVVLAPRTGAPRLVIALTRY